MPLTTRSLFQALFTCLLAGLPALALEQTPLNYTEHIKPIFRQHCLKCHGDDKHKKDLNLQSYATLLKGGSGGEVVVAGRSSQSLLVKIITDPDDDVRMPPNKSAMPAEQLAMVQQWIDEGLRESADTASQVSARDIQFAPSTNAHTRPEHPAMPEHLPPITLPDRNRPLPILAMATSPWAPLLAVAGQDHVRLIHTETEAELGKLPFPEGVPHVIRFSRNGSVLMVAGGQPVQRGSVVLYDVKSGQRLASFGDEIDAVLAADLSPDQQLVALGGSGQIVKVYSTVNAALVYKLEKHTDWITSLAFSPDGQKLATADRAGGIHLWDATSGGILLSLGEHKASVRGMDWRADSKILASVGDDGLVIWWDVKDGWPAITKPNAHPPVRPKGVYGTLPNGVLAVTFGSDGSLLTVGRNQTAQRWDADGKPIWRQATSENALPIQAAMVQNNQGQGLIVGDSVGQLKFWQVDQ